MDSFNKNDDFDYTIVMDPRYPGLDPIRHEPLAEAEKKPEQEAPAKEPEKVVIDGKLYILMPDGTRYDATGRRAIP